MIRHSYREVILKGRKKEKIKYVFSADDKYYELLAVFINSELPSFQKSISSLLEGSGEEGEISFCGNRISMKISGSTVTLCDELELADECTLKLDDLICLIDEWKELRRHLK